MILLTSLIAFRFFVFIQFLSRELSQISTPARNPASAEEL
jgi:hypothetical protein